MRRNASYLLKVLTERMSIQRAVGKDLYESSNSRAKKHLTSCEHEGNSRHYLMWPLICGSRTAKQLIRSRELIADGTYQGRNFNSKYYKRSHTFRAGSEPYEYYARLEDGSGVGLHLVGRAERVEGAAQQIGRRLQVANIQNWDGLLKAIK